MNIAFDPKQGVRRVFFEISVGLTNFRSAYLISHQIIGLSGETSLEKRWN